MINTENPIVSIIIPVYNNEKYIQECLSSVLCQTFKNIEVIVIDDGSTDRTLDICQKMSEADKRIKVFNKRNEGVSMARNAALKHISGDYIMFLDSDDKYFSNTVENMLNTIKKYNADIAICSFTEDLNYINNSKIVFNCINNNQNYINHLLFNPEVKGFVWNKIYKKNLFSNVNFPNELNVCEDLYLNCLIAKKYNPKVVVFNEKLYFYRNNQDSATRNISNLFKHDYFSYDSAYSKIKLLFESDHKNILNSIDQAMFYIIQDTYYIVHQQKNNYNQYTHILKMVSKKYNSGLKDNKKLYFKYLLFNICPNCLFYLINIYGRIK